MSITSPAFFLFAGILILLYYLIPRRMQWVLLLTASILFYLCAGWRSGVYILITALSTYACAWWIECLTEKKKAHFKAYRATLTKEERKAVSSGVMRRQRWILAMALAINLGILGVFKYAGFFAAQMDRLFGGVRTDYFTGLIVPVGISFYTFQSLGYLINVYQENCRAQRSFPKHLLFVSFFPQILQGPISNYNQLSGELFREHDFDFDNLCRGAQRMLWGYFKKLVVADNIAPLVLSLYRDYPGYAGLAAFLGMVLYSVQLYADFSGYMDIVCGLCRILGISLRENFDRPFFSRSVAEYWRRWHISMGDWFKTYVYYPAALSGWARKLGNRVSRKLPVFGKTVPATVALVLTWLATGLWHGASWGYIVWGGINGAFLIVSLWLEPVFKRWTARLGLSEEKRSWRIFQILRTNLILIFLRILPEVGGLRDGLGLWARVFRGPILPHGWSGWFPGGASPRQMLVVGFGFALMMTADAIKCRESVQDWLERRSILFRFALYFLLIAMILIFGCYGSGYDARDFMYFKF